MNVIELRSDLDAAIDLLEEEGFGFTVICSGTEPSCPDLRTPRAA